MLGTNSPISSATGQLGSIVINDTTACTGQWGEIYCVSAAVFSLLTSDKRADGITNIMTASDAGTLAHAITLAAGMHIKGVFTAITLSSGTVIAYNC